MKPMNIAVRKYAQHFIALDIFTFNYFRSTADDVTFISHNFSRSGFHFTVHGSSSTSESQNPATRKCNAKNNSGPTPAPNTKPISPEDSKEVISNYIQIS